MTDFSDIKVGDRVLVDGMRTATVTRVTDTQFVAAQEDGVVRRFRKIGGNSQDGYGGVAEPWSQDKEDMIMLKVRIYSYFSRIRVCSTAVWGLYGSDDLINKKKQMESVHTMSAMCISDIDDLLLQKWKANDRR